MSALVRVAIHPTQFPDAIRRDLLRCLRRRQVKSKFHYESVRQVEKWLTLHEACSPFRTDAGVADIYELACAAAAERISGAGARVVGLGCGGGKKDSLLLKAVSLPSRRVVYYPCDSSLGMVLVAHQTAVGAGGVTASDCFPMVCDLEKAEDLPAILREESRLTGEPVPTLFTFFGMVHNFEPGVILPRLAALLGPADHLLLSANLCPAVNYAEQMRRILRLYDNALTRDWLMCFLSDLDVQHGDGQLGFSIENAPGCTGLERVAGDFLFEEKRKIQFRPETVTFNPGDRIRLFFSTRFTPAHTSVLLSEHGLSIEGQWIAPGDEEGVFLVRKTG